MQCDSGNFSFTRIGSPQRCATIGVIQAQPGGLYLVFEFVAHDLKTFMDQYKTSNDISERVRLPVPMVRSFMKQILQGVGFCHTYRVLHRDLKPHSVSIHSHIFLYTFAKYVKFILQVQSHNFSL